MRHFFKYVVFGILSIVAVVFILQWYQTTDHRVQERLPWPSHTVPKEKPISRSQPILTPISASRDEVAKPTKPAAKPADKPVYYYAYSTTPPTSEPKKIAKNHITTIHSQTSVAAVSDSDTPKSPAPKSTSPAPDAILKYVLFSVSYDSDINAGETESLILTMSPRSARAELDAVLRDKKLQKNQITAIEKIQNQYKYASATLLAKDNCLQIQKRMPEEDKVYLHSINESTADEVWQWDITAPDIPNTSFCNLVLYIRFCFNQDDCIPSINPDKKFAIFIHITLTHKIYSWFIGLGNIAHYATAITGLMAVFISVFFWIKKRASKKDKNRR